MKKSIVLIVAQTRRTVGWLARGAAAQVRRALASGATLDRSRKRVPPFTAAHPEAS
jgi:hypothetical protein